MSNNLNFLKPTYTRTRQKKKNGEMYPHTFHSLHTNPTDPEHIIFPECERGGMRTRDFSKNINGIGLQHGAFESLLIHPEQCIDIGKLGSPQITYNNLLKKN